MFPSTWHKCWLMEHEGHLIQFWWESRDSSYWQNFHSLKDLPNVAELIVEAYEAKEQQFLWETRITPAYYKFIRLENYEICWWRFKGLNFRRLTYNYLINILFLWMTNLQEHGWMHFLRCQAFAFEESPKAEICFDQKDM